MFNPYIKFEMSTITCNEEMKSNAKCKNSCFEPPFGGLSGNAQDSSIIIIIIINEETIVAFSHKTTRTRYKVKTQNHGKRIVDFILAIIVLLSLALTAAALLSEICQNRRFLKGGSL